MKPDPKAGDPELMLESFERILALHREFIAKVPALYPGATGHKMAEAGESYIRDLRRKMPSNMAVKRAQPRE